MNSSEEVNSKEWLRKLLDGDGNAVQEFWKQYGSRLSQLAGRQLSRKLQRRVEADDVVQSACRTFFRRAEAGQFQLEESESLWRLLCAIVVNKARMKARFHLQGKRGIHQEVDQAKNPDEKSRDFAATSTPNPAEVAAYNDHFEFLMSGLDTEEKQIIQYKLEDLTNDEIAEKMACSERTVRRIFSKIRSRLIDEWQDDQ
ncbi:MAG: sigma-70 family RNA polymerase sigma factor [Planctomycetota bacterium]|nr:sigma-70 family RNA polymerase sigma factor [Planctomycetota bacterium]